MRHWLFTILFTLLFACISVVHAQDDVDRASPTIDSILRVDRVGIGRRSTVNTDAIEYMVAKGAFSIPSAGDALVAPDGSSKTWVPMEANEDGTYPPIGGGWAYATIVADEDSTWIMQGRGYRHVYINGEPRVGDLYSLGITRLPVRLNKGKNSFLFKSGRGRLQVSFEPAPASAFLETRDPTLPDLIRGDPSPSHAGIFLTNPTSEWIRGQTIRARFEGHKNSEEVSVPMIAPHSIHKIPVLLPKCPPVDAETDSIPVTLELIENDRVIGDPIAFNLRVRNANEKHSRTFISSIDGSVQYFGVTPPTDAEVETPESAHALLLTLHGASVEARNQSNAYSGSFGV